LSNHSNTTAHGQTLVPSPTTPIGGGKRPGPRLASVHRCAGVRELALALRSLAVISMERMTTARPAPSRTDAFRQMMAPTVDLTTALAALTPRYRHLPAPTSKLLPR
jgi:hypothetical protein